MPDGSVNEKQASDAVLTPPPITVAANDAPPVIEARMRPRHGPAPPVNIRVTVPILRSRFYFAVMGGRERRSRERLAIERRHNRLATRSNVLFIVIGALALYVVTLGGFLAYATMTGT